jgi:TolA-binding protein
LNFANGLFRLNNYDMAAQEYEKFLKGAKPGPDADEARFGLANSRLFQRRYDEARRQFEEFLKAAPNHPNAPTAWYRVGETAFLLGDLAAARKALEKFTAENPKHHHLETALPYLGDVYLKLEDLPRAKQTYERALATYPQGRLVDRARSGLGRTLALQGDSQGALKVLQELADHGGPEWVDKALLQIGQIQAGVGQPARALSALETLERVAPRSVLIPESRLGRAEALLKLDRQGEAEPLLRSLAAEGPPALAGQAAFTLATAQLEKGRAAESLGTVDEVLKRSPRSPMAAALLFQSAEAALKLGKADEARARYLRAFEADPADPWADDALLRAAQLALEGSDHDTARRLAGNFAARFPASPRRADARLVEGRAALASGKPKDAIKILTAGLAQDKPGPETAQAERYYLGLAYRADGQPAKEAEVFDALARTPAAAVAADAQYMLGQGHIEARRFAEAIPPLEKYLADKPNGEVADYAWAHLAQARLEQGQTDAAEKALAQLAARFPRSKALTPTRLRLAEAAVAAKQYDRAAGLFTLVAQGDDPALTIRARSGLGWALLEAGKPAEAAAAFANLLAEAPNDPHAPDAALGRGRALELAGKSNDALAAYASVSTTYPRTSQADLAALARARLLVETKHPDEAAEAFAQYVEAHSGPGQPQPQPQPQSQSAGVPALDTVLSEWAWALIDAGKTDQADEVFARLLKQFPRSPHAAHARFNLGESAFQARRYDDAIALLTPLAAPEVEAPPELVQSALYRLGRAETERKDWEAAARTFDRLLTEYPQNRYRREARFWRSEVALATDDLKTAEAGFSALAAERPEPSDPPGFGLSVRRRLIQCLVGRSKWDQAIAAAEKYRADAPQDPQLADVDYYRGRALQGLARFDEARAAYQAVIEARRGGDLAARAQLMRGETYFHQKNYRDAVSEFLKVEILYDAPAWQAAAMLEAGKVYERLAQPADAAETYERLRARFPKEPSASEAKPLLDAVRKRLASQEDAAKR